MRTTFSRWFFGVVILGTSLAPGSSWARIREADDASSENLAFGMIKLIPELHLRLPWELSTNRDIYVVFSLKARVSDLYLVGRPGVSGPDLARALERSVTGTSFAGSDVDWFEGKNGAAAHIAHEVPGVFRRTVQSTTPVGKIVQQIRYGGLIPHVLVRIPRDQVSVLLPLPYHQGDKGRWYDASAAGVSLDATVRAELSPACFGLFITAAIGLPLFPWLTLAAGLLFARARSIPLEKRKQISVLWLTRGPAVSFGLYALCYVGILSWRTALHALSSVMDGGTVGVVLLVPFVPSWLWAIGAGMALRQRLFPNAQEIEQKASLTTEEALLRRQMRRMELGVFAIAMLAVCAILFNPSFHRLTRWSMMWVIPVNVLPSLVVHWIYGKRLAAYTSRPPVPELQEMIEDLARRMNLRTTPRVVLNGTAAGRTILFVVRDTGARIRITQKLMDALTPEELRFALARAMTPPESWPSVGVMLLPLVGTGAMLWGGFVNQQWFALAAVSTFASMIAMFPLLWLVIRREERRTDRIALSVTRNLEAAESAARKLHAAVTVTKRTTHALEKRLESLRAMAGELGIHPMPATEGAPAAPSRMETTKVKGSV